jgi:hypothetical protein
MWRLELESTFGPVGSAVATRRRNMAADGVFGDIVGSAVWVEVVVVRMLSHDECSLKRAGTKKGCWWGSGHGRCGVPVAILPCVVSGRLAVPSGAGIACDSGACAHTRILMGPTAKHFS